MEAATGRKLSEPVLETRGLTKSFAGFVAVKDVDLTIRANTVHALIGPNGAGKSTVFNLLTRFLDPTSGSVHFRGRDISREKPATLARQGMVRSFQISAVFPHLSVLSNVMVALQQPQRMNFAFWRSTRGLGRLEPRALELLSDLGLDAYADRLAAELPYGRKRALEIATTLALDPEVLLLDEPMAGLAREDIAGTTELLRRVAQDRTILMVEHNLSVVADLSDTITVLRRGEVLAEGSYDDVSCNRDVMQAYLGTAA